MSRKPQSQSSTRKTIQDVLFTRRGGVTALVLLAILAMAFATVSISSAQSKKRAKAQQKAKTASIQQQLFKMKGEAEPQTGSRPRSRAQRGEGDEEKSAGRPLRPGIASDTGKPIDRKPVESRLAKSGSSFDGDLRGLPYVKPVAKEKPERGEPAITRGLAPKAPADTGAPEVSAPAIEPSVPDISAPAPAPIANFDGLDRENWGNGSPPDTNGDVGPNHYIQSVNTSVGIYDKTTGAPIARFIFNTLMSQGNFGNVCDTDNFGDPVVLYDTFEDRWVITDFAFQLDGSDNVINPPGAYQCFAVSKTSDPVSGGWNFYSINTAGGLGDYPKFGIWPDGLYMTTSMFDYAATGGFQNPRAYAFNKAQMYAGAPTVQVVSFNLPSADFTVLPSNARLQTGTPPAGTPNYYVSTWQYLNAVSVYKFHVDWTSIPLSTFSAETLSIAPTSWPNANVGTAPQSGTTNTLDTLEIRAMMQNQYTNIGGVESVWNTHTVRRANTTGFGAPRWYQVGVTGGTIGANVIQGTTWDPDAANVMWRFMPSLAVDRAGNMALGYSTSSSTTFPSIKYAGRLSTDAVNTFSQTEQLMFAGTASQTGTVTRWGDYSAMSVDPDGCTFWFTTQYVNPALPQSGTNRWKTRIGSFKYTQCTPVGNGGTISGTVTANPGGAPISGATVALGSRTTTTDGSGNYSFSVPAGTYPGMTASFPGRTSASASSIPVTDGNITIRNFSLSGSATSGCLTDTTQADFQTGLPTSVDLITSAGNVTLSNDANVNQQALDNGFGSGYGFTNTSIIGQTFTPNATGQLTKVDASIFCATCSGANPNMTLEVRTTSAGLPVMTAGGLLATSTIAGTSSGSSATFTFPYGTPPTLTSGTQYGIVIRLTAARTGTQAWVATSGDTYAGGRRVICTTSACSNPTGQNANSELVFKAYMKTGFATSGNLISSVKDANPAAGSSPTWGTLSWTATTPASTNVQFQVAASNNPAGVFNFVGPNGTAATFFTNGGTLAQFNGFRYVKYKALLTGTSIATPTLADATVCFADVIQTATTLTAAPATGTFGGTVNLSATLTDGTNPISGQSIAFTLNGVSKGSASTDGSGVATISNVSLSGINAGSYPTGVGASFAGGGGFSASNSTAALTVNPANQTITFGALANKTYGDADFNVSATASSGLTVSFSAAGNCTVTGTSVHITGAGSCTITASQAGNSNYNAAPNVQQSFNIAQAGTTTTVTVSNATYDGNPHGGTASVTGAGGLNQSLTVSYSGRNSTVYGPSTTAPTNAGDYTASANYAGNANYSSSNDSKDYSIAKANTTTTVTAINAGYDGNPHGGTATVTGAGGLNQSLTVTYSGRNATVYGPSTTAPTNAGEYTASASYAGDSNYNSSNDSKDYSIAKANQTITFGALSDKTYGDADFTVSATASSSLAVSFAASGNCTVTGTTVHITGGGSCTITASQGGDSNYNAAANVPRSFNIAKADQTITFGTLADKTYGDPDFTVSASASSGLAVSFSASGNCTVTGDSVHITGGGSCTITASQAGDGNYNAATNVDRSFDIAKANQTITFGALGDKTYGDADFTVSATASSGLAVSFAALGNCTVTGDSVHITGAGSCTITASQAGDGNYNAASDVARSFNIAKADTTTTVTANNATYDGNPHGGSASVTGPVGLNESLTVTYTGRNSTVYGPSTTAPTDAGDYTASASYAGDSNYNSSNDSADYTITKANQTITFGALADKTYGDADFSVSASASSGLAVSFSALGNCTVTGSTVHITGAGSCTITASQGGDSNYNAAANVDQSFNIAKATPTITWSNPADIIYGTALSGTQLNASGSVPGSFVYTPAAGTVLASGNGQNLHADFTPTDTTNYNNATKDVAINVLSALLTTKMVADRDPALVGYNHNYLIDIDNSGSASATSMTLSDPLPPEVRFTAVTTTQGSCAYNPGTHTVSCTLGTVGVGGNVHIQLTTKTLQPGMLDNTATVNALQWDPATGGNTASVNDLEAIALTDVAISKIDSADPIFVGQTTTYTIVVKNYNTPISATGVVMTDNLPASFQFVSATTSQGNLVTPPVGSTGIVTANVGTLAINGTATITITVRATASGTITNTATATENENDSNTVNNSASQSTTVNVAALQKVLLASQTLVGGCQNTTGNVYLTGAAPTGGITVNLSTTNLAGVTVPASVFIPAGQTVSPAFNVTTSQVATKQVGTVNATLGASTVSRGLTINVGNGTCP